MTEINKAAKGESPLWPLFDTLFRQHIRFLQVFIPFGVKRRCIEVAFLNISFNVIGKGVALGIVTEQRESQYSSEGYYVNYYPQTVQQFIFDNLPAVAEFLAKEKEENNAKA